MPTHLYCIQWSAMSEMKTLNTASNKSQELSGCGLGIFLERRLDRVVDSHDAADEDARGYKISHHSLVVCEGYGKGSRCMPRRMSDNARDAKPGDIESVATGEQNVGFKSLVALMG